MKQFTVVTVVIFFLATGAARAQIQKVLLDNDKMRITEYISKPGEEVCGKGMHSHGDHSTILLTNTRVETTEKNGQVLTEDFSADKQTYSVVKNGHTTSIASNGVFWAKEAIHDVKNVGENVVTCYIIEAK